ncbi:MAG: hypothetical protein H0V19_07715 [Euzebyales bacterium]|nr:hypothetical protein [Euzebyales bacterium]
MSQPQMEDGLHVFDLNAAESEPQDREQRRWSAADASDLESLRDEFVDGFNARDIEALLGIVSADVECPDMAADGASAFAEELEAIWERSPGAILTRAFLDEMPCAVAWRPDEDGCWFRAALVTFDDHDGLLSVVAMPDDADGLDRSEAEDPTGEELEEWSDWAEWDRGEETVAPPRDRDRP